MKVLNFNTLTNKKKEILQQKTYLRLFLFREDSALWDLIFVLQLAFRGCTHPTSHDAALACSAVWSVPCLASHEPLGCCHSN